MIFINLKNNNNKNYKTVQQINRICVSKDLNFYSLFYLNKSSSSI